MVKRIKRADSKRVCRSIASHCGTAADITLEDRQRTGKSSSWFFVVFVVIHTVWGSMRSCSVRGGVYDVIVRAETVVVRRMMSTSTVRDVVVLCLALP